MTDHEADWRLRGQERHLAGVELVRRTYAAPRSDWDHDHCEFCWAKFAPFEGDEVLHEGYCTRDGTRWVCPGCFEDFRERFGWSVTSGNGEEGT